ncbi:MAG: putative toxin-antitoxin system toxin component, PIN family [Phycisphaerae bacterium]|nr:putative toxin-antitoxin system toxin component, PIN family [Phycisphaerae bacterium]
MRVVLDTNVLLAAFACGGVCRDVFKNCLLVHHVFLSEYILEEFQRKSALKFHMPEKDIQANLDFLRRHCQIIIPHAISPDACPDPDDLPILGTVRAAEAHCLITGDKALLNMETFQTHHIVSPRVFLDQTR